MNNTIELMKKGSLTYFISEISEQDKNLIKDTKSTENKESLLAAYFLLIDKDCVSVKLLGETANLSIHNTGEFIGSFAGRVIDNDKPSIKIREVHYRNYVHSEERQKSSAWLINMGTDKLISINSLKKKLNSKYCVIWIKKN